MRKGKFERSGSKALVMILAVILVLGSVIGGTMAWLVAASDEVVNTFTYGDINIDLDETDSDEDGNPDENDYEMMPGQDIAKDPKVTVKADSEENWLFVKLEKSENFDDFLTYTIGEGWTQLYDAEGNEVEGVYYRFQAETTEDVTYSILKDDQVTVLPSVTKEMLNELDAVEGEETYPTLTVTAYAVQYVGFEAEVEEGAEEATPEAVNAAALAAWGAALNPTGEEPAETTAP